MFSPFTRQMSSRITWISRSRRFHFFQSMAQRDHFEFKATSNWKDMNPETLKQYQVVLWLDDAPSTAVERVAFQLHGARRCMAGLSFAGWMESRAMWPWYATFRNSVLRQQLAPIACDSFVDDRQVLS